MNDPQNPKPPEPELELARPVRSQSQPPRPSVSNPNLQAVRTAQRSQPLAAEAKGPTSERLKEGAADTVLNSISILSEIVEDFRSSDRFFKYKAGVLSLWFLLVIGAFGIACPSTGPSNDIDAVLVSTAEDGRTIYMIKNDGTTSWQDVEITVNGNYRATLTEVKPEGGSITLSAAVLFDDQGKRAPSAVQVTDIAVKVREPEATVTLLSGGQPVQ